MSPSSSSSGEGERLGSVSRSHCSCCCLGMERKGGKTGQKNQHGVKRAEKIQIRFRKVLSHFRFFLNEGYFQFVMFGLNKPIEKEYFVILCH